MTNTIIIGQTILVRDWANRSYHSNLVFYGCNRFDNHTWSVNICKEIGNFNGIIEESLSGSFCINVQVGNTFRFYDYYVYLQKNSKVGFHSDYVTDSQKGRREVKSIKFTDLGPDYITIEYDLV